MANCFIIVILEGVEIELKKPFEIDIIPKINNIEEVKLIRENVSGKNIFLIFMEKYDLDSVYTVIFELNSKIINALSLFSGENDVFLNEEALNFFFKNGKIITEKNILIKKQRKILDSNIKKIKEQDFKKYLEDYSKFEKEDDFCKYAIEQLTLSRNENKIIAFIRLIFAFEALLSDTEKINISFKLRQRISLLIGKDVNERKDISEEIKKIYNSRSNIVHGEIPTMRNEKKEKNLDENIKNLKKYLSKSIMKYVEIKSTNNFSKKTEVISYLDELALKDKK